MSRAKLPPDELRKRIVSIRCSQAEFQDIEKAADLAQLSLSDWVRDTTLATARGTIAMSFPVPVAAVPAPAVLVSEGWAESSLRPGDVISMDVRYSVEPPPEPPNFKPAELTDVTELPLSWADHWALMERMEPGEATERLFELAAGRKFPDAFPRWSKARKIEWLDKEMPL